MPPPNTPENAGNSDRIEAAKKHIVNSLRDIDNLPLADKENILHLGYNLNDSGVKFDKETQQQLEQLAAKLHDRDEAIRAQLAQLKPGDVIVSPSKSYKVVKVDYKEKAEDSWITLETLQIKPQEQDSASKPYQINLFALNLRTDEIEQIIPKPLQT